MKNNYKKAILLAIALTSLFYFTLYKTVKYIELRDKTIFMDGYEVGNYEGLTEGYNNAQEENWNMLSKNPEVVFLLKKYFLEYTQARTAAAIIQAESKFIADAKNYNCYYIDDKGKQYSAQCKKGDEYKAWSVDCGMAQLNYHGKVCPSWTMDPELNIKKMKSMYDNRGWTPWVTFNKGLHLTYLK